MKYQFLAFGLAVVAAISKISPAYALSRVDIETQTALSSVPQVTVPTGHSVVLDFKNGDYIQSIWIDAPSLVGLTTNRPLCSTASSSDCGFATSLRLTQLTGSLNLPGVSYADDGLNTIISIQTTDRNGGNANIYQFVVNAISAATADATLISIVPAAPAEEPESVLSTLRRQQRPQSFDLAAIRIGKAYARTSAQADMASEAWAQLETFMELAETLPIAEAIARSGVSIELLSALQRFGDASTNRI